jgi:DNA-directed RNA polymerase specialized sigma24 family protein
MIPLDGDGLKDWLETMSVNVVLTAKRAKDRRPAPATGYRMYQDEEKRRPSQTDVEKVIKTRNIVVG